MSNELPKHEQVLVIAILALIPILAIVGCIHLVGLLFGGWLWTLPTLTVLFWLWMGVLFLECAISQTRLEMSAANRNRKA